MQEAVDLRVGGQVADTDAQLDSALRRSRLTANTALDGRPSDEQADLTDTQTPCSLSAC